MTITRVDDFNIAASLQEKTLSGLAKGNGLYHYLQFANRELMIVIMKKHNGMCPQDIAVLLKIISTRDDRWRNIDIANAVGISPSEASEALNRCKFAKLIDSKKRKVHINSFTEFLVYGLKYVFPTEPGAIVKGTPTAHSSSPVKEHI